MKSAKRARKYRKRLDTILNFYKKLIQLRKELPVVLCNLCEEENKVVWQSEWDSYELLLGNYSDGKVDGTLRPYECKVMRSI